MKFFIDMLMKLLQSTNKGTSVVTPIPKPTPVVTTTPAPVVVTTPAPVVIQPSIVTIGVDYQISPHFTYGMMTKTEHRDLLDKNRAEGQKYLKNITNLCVNILEPAWTLVGPLSINSCFRCADLNAQVGGATNSQHMTAEAADTEYAGKTLKQAFNLIAFSSLKYSQIIIEFNQWIHVGIIDTVLYPGKIGQKFLAERHVYKEGEKGYDPKNPNKTHTVYVPVMNPL